MCTAHASDLMDRWFVQKCKNRGALKMQQLSWVANMTRIMPWLLDNERKKTNRTGEYDEVAIK